MSFILHDRLIPARKLARVHLSGTVIGAAPCSPSTSGDSRRRRVPAFTTGVVRTSVGCTATGRRATPVVRETYSPKGVLKPLCMFRKTSIQRIYEDTSERCPKTSAERIMAFMPWVIITKVCNTVWQDKVCSCQYCIIS